MSNKAGHRVETPRFRLSSSAWFVIGLLGAATALAVAFGKLSQAYRMESARQERLKREVWITEALNADGSVYGVWKTFERPVYVDGRLRLTLTNGTDQIWLINQRVVYRNSME